MIKEQYDQLTENEKLELAHIQNFISFMRLNNQTSIKNPDIVHSLIDRYFEQRNNIQIEEETHYQLPPDNQCHVCGSEQMAKNDNDCTVTCTNCGELYDI